MAALNGRRRNALCPLHPAKSTQSPRNGNALPLPTHQRRHVDVFESSFSARDSSFRHTGVTGFAVRIGSFLTKRASRSAALGGDMHAPQRAARPAGFSRQRFAGTSVPNHLANPAIPQPVPSVP